MASNKIKITSPQREGKEEKETNWKIRFICQEEDGGGEMVVPSQWKGNEN